MNAFGNYIISILGALAWCYIGAAHFGQWIPEHTIVWGWVAIGIGAVCLGNGVAAAAREFRELAE